MRTPDEGFSDLPDFSYLPTYIDDLDGYEGLRAAVVDEGPKTANETFLCLHGQPTWSYLYRKMIPIFLDPGARLVAPDFFGFGRSDKPTDDGAYSFHFHRDYLLRLMERLDLNCVTLVVQDWGGLIGLTLPVDPGARARITKLIVMNTCLAVGEPPSDGFLAWRSYAATHPDMDVAALLKRATPSLTQAEAGAFGASFPNQMFKAGVRAFPKLVMTEPGMPGVEESKAAQVFWSTGWNGKSFMAYGATDPVFTPAHMEALRVLIRGCPPAMAIKDAGHFVQERDRKSHCERCRFLVKAVETTTITLEVGGHKPA